MCLVFRALDFVFQYVHMPLCLKDGSYCGSLLHEIVLCKVSCVWYFVFIWVMEDVGKLGLFVSLNCSVRMILAWGICVDFHCEFFFVPLVVIGRFHMRICLEDESPYVFW